MTTDPNETTDGRTEGQTADRVASGSSRRDFLKATAGAGALAVGVGSGAVGTSAAGIPTPRLTVDGNLIKDPQGEPVKLRGLNIADPKRMDVTAPARGKTAAQVIEMLTNADEGWYPRVLRVPVQPTDIGEHPPGPVAEGDPAPPVPAFDQSQLETYLETYLDPVVDLCAEKGVYCIVDYHRHWKGVRWAEGQDGPINEPLQEEVLNFWQTVAPRYADMSHVFFEIYNEPTKPGFYSSRYKNGDPAPWLQERWDLWRDMAQPWVDAIREHSENLIIVGSPGWSQTPEGATIFGEFEGENLSYTYHTYPGHAANNENSWAEQGGHDYSGVEGAFEEVPLFVTEFGWQDNFPGHEPHRWISGTTEGFGRPFIDWLESEPSLHWTAWCADPIWLPAMFRRGFETPDTTDSIGNPYEGDVPVHCEDLPCEWELRGNPDMGQLVKDTLRENRDDGVPSGNGGDTPDDTPEDTPDDTPDDTPEDTPEDTPDDTPGGSTPVVSITAESVQPGGTTEAAITLSRAPNGLSGYDLKVSVADTDVATVESVSVEESPAQTVGDGGTAVAEDGSSATVQAADLNEEVGPGAEDVRLATVSLAGQATGETEVAVAVRNIDSDGGEDVSVKTTAAALEVAQAGDVEPIDGTTPQDVDGDGDFEDLNGNGEVDYQDVVVYFNHMDEPVISEHVAAYDYNGNGEIDFADVVSLFDEVE